jgi:flagellar motor switch protein FliN
VTTEEALLQLGDSTAEAVERVLQTLAPGGIHRGAVSAAGVDAAFAGAVVPAVAVVVSYVDGVKGGNVFLVSLAAARKLAAAMMGLAEPQETSPELTELELSAVSEAANQMMAAAAGATSVVLGEEVEIDFPRSQVIATIDEAQRLCDHTPHGTAVGFTIFDEPCRLVQLVPNAFVVRMRGALGARSGTLLEASGQGDEASWDPQRLHGVRLRVWAELGRARLPVGQAVGLGAGAVVELDRQVDDPIELYVNGNRFAAGRLIVSDDGDWAVQIDEISHPPSLTAKGVE